MALIDDLKQQRAEYDERYQRSMMDHAYFVGRLNDLDTAIAALEAPAQPLPSVELLSVTPATEEESGGPIIDAQTCEPIDPHVSWEPPPPVEAEPDPLVDAGGYAPVTEEPHMQAISANLSATLERDFAEKARRCEGCGVSEGNLHNPGCAFVAKSGWLVDFAYESVDSAPKPEDEPASVLDDPELQAAVDRAQATLVDAELDAELDRVREQERARAKHHFSIFGKLEDA